MLEVYSVILNVEIVRTTSLITRTLYLQFFFLIKPSQTE